MSDSDPLHARLDAVRPGDGPGAYRVLAREIEAAGEDLEPLSLGLLTSYTSDFLDPFIRVECARQGFVTRIWRGAFGEVESAIHDWDCASDGAVRDALVVQLRPEDVSPGTALRFGSSRGADFETLLDDILDRLTAAVALYRERGGTGPVLVANFAPIHLPGSILDAGMREGRDHRIARANLSLAERLEEHPGCHVWDYAALVADYGASRWSDPRLLRLARTPVAGPAQPHLAAHLARSLAAVQRPAAKCLVLDLDGTLWGGAVGDVGIEGIQVGDDFPGNAYKALQRAALSLRDRGVLLAVASRNDEAVALDAMARHPDMLIRPADLAAHRIHWDAKSDSLLEIAEELGIGTDALVFFDDNPLERAEVRAHLPEVRIVEAPGDPVEYVDALMAFTAFDAPPPTAEDLGRADQYTAEKRRRSRRRAAVDDGDFLASLEMSATLGALDDTTSSRIAQLVGKTNQYNTTTRRRTQSELEGIAASENGAVRWLRLRDRYGDLGLIGITVLVVEGETAVLDSLVMSCRAANRGVEQALVADACRQAVARGCRRLVGVYTPSERNHPVAELYSALGFSGVPSEESVSRYELDVAQNPIAWPEAITLFE